MCNTMVSVICNVYNHEKYLKQTLEGFVSQITDFDFEVLIHDDASTDSSADIIREYEHRFPQIIKPIYQKQNQYSQGVNIFRTYTLPRIKGKYMATCEGDDCWIDQYKLSKQVSYMETHPDCTFCFTNGIIENVQNGKRRKFIPYKSCDKQNISTSGIYNVAEVANFSFLPTCSFLYPVKNFEKFPAFFWEKGFAGDRKSTLYHTSLGYACFIDECTCCYHYGVPGSAMTRRKTKIQLAEIEYSYVRLYNRINQFTEYRFDSIFKKMIIPYLINTYCLQGNKEVLSNDEMIIAKNAMSFSDQIKKYVIGICSDNMINFGRDLKRKLL